MKVLIIGSKGFIGSAVASQFSARFGYEVYECDVAVDYARKNYFLLDATNADYHSLFRDFSFDVCINCSGAANVSDSLANPFRDYTLNTFNVFKLLDAIRIYQPECKFLNLSSAAVYGNPINLPVSERMEPNPVSPYGEHKLQAELIAREFYLYYNVPSCSLRIFSAYGPGLKKQLFWDIYKKASAYEVIELFGTGRESRDFIYIDDLVNAIHCCLNRAAFKSEVINIANGEEVSVHHAVMTFLSFFPGKKEIYFSKAAKLGDPLCWKADISQLKGMGYKASASLSAGLKNYYSWVTQL